jgi:hypothetical protein
VRKTVAETTFGIAYDGPELATGRMPVRELAPALLALGDLFAVASDILHPDWKPVSLNIEATEKGSFFVHLYLEAEAVWDQLVNIFSSEELSALTNLKEVVIGPGVGLFYAIKTLRGARVKELPAPSPGTVKLQVDESTSLEMPSDTWELYKSVEVRKAARRVVEPLEQTGIEVVTFTAEMRTREELEITKADLPAFALPEGREEPLLDTEQEMFVEIASVAFPRGNKWRLSTGDFNFWATIDDDQFLDRVESGRESFRKGDVLRCKMEVVQTRGVDGLHTEYTVVEVLEHRPQPRQLLLDEGDARSEET